MTNGSTAAASPHLPPSDKVVFETTLGGQPSLGPGATATLAAHRVLRTTEVDAYEPSPSPADVAPFSAQPAGDLDSFMGTARKAAKLSLSSAKAEAFEDVSALIGTLTAEKAMRELEPPILTDAASKRVKQEQRNVKVQAFLYAASREADNDFHLIVGRDPAAKPSVYMTVEVSGLPPKKSKGFAKLNAARNSFKTFFGAQLPNATYDFYDPPIPLELEGSLFFDMSHAQGGRPGPATLRPHMPTIWEIHPLSRIGFSS
jgi:hypothetical protein